MVEVSVIIVNELLDLNIISFTSQSTALPEKRLVPGPFFLIFHFPTVLFLSVFSGFTIGSFSSNVPVTVFELSITTSNGLS